MAGTDVPEVAVVAATSPVHGEAADGQGVPRLRRTLGQRDLVFLFVVAVVNLNTVPIVASGGAATVWMWGLALLLFFLPQGLAVIELSQRYPQEGGVYLWTKTVFGDFHGFISGWCYWRRTLPRAVIAGGFIAGSLYVGATIAVLVAMPARDIGAVQGILQAVNRMAATVGVAWIVPPIALLLSLAFAGTTSAWLAGSARIPFVAGIDNYLPAVLGRLHSRYATPHVALLTQAVVSCVVLAMGFVGSTVQEAYRVLLLLAVVLQLTPFGSVFASLIKLASDRDFQRVRYSRAMLLTAGTIGFIVTVVGASLAFVPADRGQSAGVYETKMIAGTAFFLALGAVIFYRSSRERAWSL